MARAGDPMSLLSEFDQGRMSALRDIVGDINVVLDEVHRYLNEPGSCPNFGRGTSRNLGKSTRRKSFMIEPVLIESCAGCESDSEFFRLNPKRRYRVRPASDYELENLPLGPAPADLFWITAVHRQSEDTRIRCFGAVPDFVLRQSESLSEGRAKQLFRHLDPRGTIN
jgi:hypothetical protein